MKKGGSSALAAMIKQKSVTLYGSNDEKVTDSNSNDSVYISSPINSPHIVESPSKTEELNRTLSPSNLAIRSTSLAMITPSIENAGLSADGSDKNLTVMKETNHISAVAPSTISPLSPSKPIIAAKSSVVTEIKNSQPVKYTPKVVKMAFESTPKCTVCDKSVYKMEEVIAVGRIWHSACFTCGGNNKNGLGCKKVMTRHNYVDHENDPYCNTCHSKLFKPKGYGNSNTLELDYGPTTNTQQSSKGYNSPPLPPNTTTEDMKASIAPSRPVMLHKQASEPVITAQKSTTIGGAPKCTLCLKSVYKAEEVTAVGHVWHKTCFTCGARNQDGCKKVLSIVNYVDHQNCPYCNSCHSKLFKPKGFGYGNAVELDYGPALQSTSESSSKSDTVQDMKPSQPPPLPHSTTTEDMKTSIAPSRPVMLHKQASEPVITAQKSTTIGGAPKCTLCLKSVYKAEEVTAVGHVWHKTCFTCGARNQDGCKKVLSIVNYVDHQNCPYCNSCHSKLFKPKGFGYGNAVELDYGPALQSTSSNNVSLESGTAATSIKAVPGSIAQDTDLDASQLSNLNINIDATTSKLISNEFPQPNLVAPIPITSPQLQIGRHSATRGITFH